MSPSHTSFVRQFVPAAFAALILAGCGGNGFTTGSTEPDGSVTEAGPDGDIIVGPDTGAPHDAATDAPHEHDAETDALSDASGHEDATGGDSAPLAEGGEPDSATMPEASVDAAPDSPGCPTGYLDCSGVCTQNGLSNCGSCGHDCANLPHVSGGATCSAGGVCTFTDADCALGWTHCTTNPDDGCETNTTVSPNCGGCGVTCSGGTPQCNGTMCVSGCTPPKSTLCNGTTCVDTGNDPQNCNGCGDVCAAGPANSTPTCTNSTCGYACNMNYTGCPVSAPTTCENLTNDPNNCGACAHVCDAPANGSTSCVSSTCTPTCTGTTPNLCASEGTYGTCVSFSGDVNDCGSCGNVCGAGTNKPAPTDGSSICASGTCDFTCEAGYTKCETQWECLAPPLTGAAFVSAGSGFTPSSTGGCGTAAQPCENLSDGVAYAKTKSYASLYVAHGTYGVLDGPIVLDPATSLAVYGGWTYASGTWTPDCAWQASSTTIAAPAGASQAVEIAGGTIVLQWLTIQNETTAAVGTSTTAGQSLYGVLIAASTGLTLTNVDIQVAEGGNGGSGVTGQAATVPSPPCASGTGANGTPAGTNGSPGQNLYGVVYQPGNGGAGTAGGSGQNGQAATPPSSSSCLSEVLCKEQLDTCQITNMQSCGDTGTNGCGSTGAGGGGGGTGGGASIGVYNASSAAVTYAAGTITTGAGGTGGNGAGPGGQLSGTAGQPGNPGPTVCLEASNCGTVPACTLKCAAGETGSAPGGAAGGTGGEGAAGGTGTGGNGGDSHCYANGGTGSVTLAATCDTGSAGSGGTPNGAAGSNTAHN
jgi:hypothetical protein